MLEPPRQEPPAPSRPPPQPRAAAGWRVPRLFRSAWLLTSAARPPPLHHRPAARRARFGPFRGPGSGAPSGGGRTVPGWNRSDGMGTSRRSWNLHGTPTVDRRWERVATRCRWTSGRRAPCRAIRRQGEQRRAGSLRTRTRRRERHAAIHRSSPNAGARHDECQRRAPTL